MNVVFAAVIGLSIAFLLRFLVALHKEARWFSSRPVIIPHMRQRRPLDRARVVVMNPKEIEGKGNSAMDRRIGGWAAPRARGERRK